jgi:hypothetical protein
MRDCVLRESRVYRVGVDASKAPPNKLHCALAMLLACAGWLSPTQCHAHVMERTDTHVTTTTTITSTSTSTPQKGTKTATKKSEQKKVKKEKSLGPAPKKHNQ